VLCAKLIGGYLLIVRRHSIELLNQLQCHKLAQGQFRGTTIISHPALEAVVMTSPSPMSKKGHCEQSVHPLSIILRCCDDGFDTIRQYDLPVAPTIKQHSSEGDELPWILPTDYTCVMSVAPSSHYFRAGPRGKGFWMQTKNVSSRRSVHPARCIVGFDIMNDSKDGPTSDLQSTQVPVDNDLHICEQSLYSRRCDPGEIVRKKYCLHSADIEDTVGRIVVGDRQGKIEILDYV